jgi:hypothetical protein
MLFALAGGLTLSAIVANLYRLVARKPQSRLATWIYCGVMLLAGASVLFENSTRSFRKKECSHGAYVFALALASYWSLMLGLAVIRLGAVV